jgi:hypothetical protein
MQKLLCSIGIHKYRTIEMTDCFTTSYVDKPNWQPTRHMVWYQICMCCGKRRLKDTVNKDSIVGGTRHNGVEYARTGWVEYGKMYLGNGEVKQHPPKHKAEIVQFKVHDGGKN